MPLLRSWVASANSATTDFPLNNLPYGVFSTADIPEPHCGVAIGEQILDLFALEADGLLTLEGGPFFDVPFWNDFMAAGHAAWDALRAFLLENLAEGAAKADLLAGYLVAQADAQMHLPFLVSELTDFYGGRNHAINVGSMFRDPANALPPNWSHLPIGYNGRASSVVVSGTEIRRPWGQLKGPNDALPRFAPCERFDIELEIGAVVGLPTTHGQPVTVEEADALIFGYVLLNDWSARDIQTWEYQPLGPFQSKATATSISPWIVTKAALSDFRIHTPPHDTPLLPHLRETGPMIYDIDLEVLIQPEGGAQSVISRTNYDQMWYSAAQCLAHHTTSGCAMNTGDLLGSGTISGTTPDSRGSLLEISWGGKEPFAVDGGTRSFINDNDTLTLRGTAKGDGFNIGFGDCVGKVLPALADPYAR